MNHALLSDWMAAILWVAILAFAVLGGADFGAGVWDLLARGRLAAQQRAAIVSAIGPIWEANEIWVIFIVTGAWTAFPLAFTTIMISLFVPMTIALLGIVMRGAAFAFYEHFISAPHSQAWARAFSIASLAAPYLIGSMAAAVASGDIRVLPGVTLPQHPILPWVSPFAITTGCFAVALCAVLAAVYMCVEAARQGHQRLTLLFRRRALISGVVVGVLGAVDAFIAMFDAPYLFAGLTNPHKALFVVFAAMLGGLVTGAVLLLGYYRFARLAVASTVTLALAAWSVAQLPYLIVPDVTIAGAAAPSGVLTVMLITTLFTMFLVLPALYYMLNVYKLGHPRPSLSANEFIERIELAHNIEMEHVREQEAEEHRVSRVNGKKLGRMAAEGAAALAITILTTQGDTIWRRLRRREAHHDETRNTP